MHDQPPQDPGGIPDRVAAAGQRVARRPVRDRQHQVGGTGTGRKQPGRGLVVGRGGQAADHRAGRRVGGPGHVQGAPLQADVAGRRLAQRGGRERRRRHGGAGQDRAVGEEHADVVAEAPVEDGEHQPQPGVEFLRPQPGVQVTHVVLREDGHGPGRLDLRVGEGLAAELGILQDPDAREPADLRAVVPPPGRQDHGHPLAVPGRQLQGDPVGQGPVTADDEVAVATIRTPGERRHAEIIVAGRAQNWRRRAR